MIIKRERIYDGCIKFIEVDFIHTTYKQKCENCLNNVCSKYRIYKSIRAGYFNNLLKSGKKSQKGVLTEFR